MDTPSSDTPASENPSDEEVLEEQGPTDWEQEPKSDDGLTPETRAELGLEEKTES